MTDRYADIRAAVERKYNAILIEDVDTIRALLAERDALREALEAIVSHHDDYFKDSATESNMPWIGQARAALAQEQGESDGNN